MQLLHRAEGTVGVAAGDSLAIRVRLMREDARIPERKSEGAAGYDCYAVGNATVVPLARARVPLGFAIALPTGWEAQIRGRSGLTWDHGLLCHVGTIDSDHRGEVDVVLFNIGRAPYVIRAVDRIAHMVIAPVFVGPLVAAQELPATSRGAQGFGSTGR